MITIYSDGGCSPNPGLGAWSFVVIKEGKVDLFSEAIGESTNSICELKGAIEALKHAISVGEKDIEFYVDSDYVRLGITEWIPNWIKPKTGRKPWMTSNNKPVKNKELWLELYQLSSQLNINWKWVKAHNGDHYNEMVDAAVVEARNKTK